MYIILFVSYCARGHFKIAYRITSLSNIFDFLFDKKETSRGILLLSIGKIIMTMVMMKIMRKTLNRFSLKKLIESTLVISRRDLLSTFVEEHIRIAYCLPDCSFPLQIGRKLLSI